MQNRLLLTKYHVIFFDTIQRLEYQEIIENFKLYTNYKIWEITNQQLSLIIASRQTLDSVKNGPVHDQHRSCNDICCLITFIILILGTLAMGIVSLVEGKAAFLQFNLNRLPDYEYGISTYPGLLGGMLTLSIFLSPIIMILMKQFPKFTTIVGIILFFVILIALAVLGFISQNYALGSISAMLIVSNLIILLCFRKRIKAGIKLLKIAGQFINERKGVFGAPLFTLLIAIIFFTFLFIATFAHLYLFNIQFYGTNMVRGIAFFVYFAFIFSFMQSFLAYVQTYMIATACSFWYYGIEENYFLKGLKTMNRYHLGSFTFGALVEPFISLFNIGKNKEPTQKSDNGCAKLCNCCLNDLVRTLNRKAVIIMSVTGYSYVDCARSTLELIKGNFQLFYTIRLISSMMSTIGIVISAGIPTLITYFVTRRDQDLGFSFLQQHGITLIVFILSMFLSVFLTSLVGQALQCMFIMYCLDQKLLNQGIQMKNPPNLLKKLNEMVVTKEAKNDENYHVETAKELVDYRKT